MTKIFAIAVWIPCISFIGNLILLLMPNIQYTTLELKQMMEVTAVKNVNSLTSAYKVING